MRTRSRRASRTSSSSRAAAGSYATTFNFGLELHRGTESADRLRRYQRKRFRFHAAWSRLGRVHRGVGASLRFEALLWRLRAGRLEDHPEADLEPGPALRIPDRSGRPLQPAVLLRLQRGQSAQLHPSARRLKGTVVFNGVNGVRRGLYNPNTGLRSAHRPRLPGHEQTGGQGGLRHCSMCRRTSGGVDAGLRAIHSLGDRQRPTASRRRTRSTIRFPAACFRRPAAAWAR